MVVAISFDLLKFPQDLFLSGRRALGPPRQNRGKTIAHLTLKAPIVISIKFLLVILM